MRFSPLLEELIEALRCLPGVGPKSAQRMAIHLLERDRDAAKYLSATVHKAIEQIGRCQMCRTLTELPICELCANPRRNAAQLCIVETPMDLMAIEQMGQYSGRYFVLMGRLSPLDGIGPDELKLEQLSERLQNDAIDEMILALSPTVEGEATANYLIQLANEFGKPVSRITYGVPFGGELEYADHHTLAHAFNTRQVVE